MLLGLCKQFQRRRGKTLYVYLAIIFTFFYSFFYKTSFSNSGNRIQVVVDGKDAVESMKNIGKIEGNKHKEKLKVSHSIAADSNTNNVKDKADTQASKNKWAINYGKKCGASTLNSQFSDFTKSNEQYWSSITQKEKDQYTREWKDYLNEYELSSKKYDSNPKDSQFIRRGVIFAAHPGAIKSTLVSIKFLRKHGCDLPVEIWHMDEMGDKDKAILEKMDNTKVFNLKHHGQFSFERGPDGKMFQVKVASILSSKLDEILFLDSDNTAVTDPSFLFDSQAFIETGAIFWKDFWKTNPNNPIWDILELECVDEFEQESGQMLINKKFPGVMKALRLSLYLQSHSSVYFKLLLGDKDTFRLAWRAIGQPFHLVRTNTNPVGQMDSSKFNGHSMLQYAPFWGPVELYGSPPDDWTDPTYPIPLFIHSNLLKYRSWTPDQSEILFDKVQRYKDKPVAPDAVGEYDGSMRLFNIDGVHIEVVEFNKLVPGHEKFFRALYDN